MWDLPENLPNDDQLSVARQDVWTTDVYFFFYRIVCKAAGSRNSLNHCISFSTLVETELQRRHKIYSSWTHRCKQKYNIKVLSLLCYILKSILCKLLERSQTKVSSVTPMAGKRSFGLIYSIVRCGGCLHREAYMMKIMPKD